MISTRDVLESRSSATPLLRVSGLTKRFGGMTVVNGVELEIAPGEIRGLCGHNGAGKSTVIRMISGQMAPDAGEIVVNGRSLRLRSRQQAQREGIALVDQELSLVPSLTIAENLVLGDVTAGLLVRPAKLRRLSKSLLDSVGLDYLDPATPVSQLSLGERQLVELARAVNQGSRLLILDEPTATLNDTESVQVYDAARRVAATGCSVVFVSHRLGEVLQLCDSVTVMRDGKIVATSPSSELTVPALIDQMLGEQPAQEALTSSNQVESDRALVVRHLTVPGAVSNFRLTAHSGQIYALAGQVGSGSSDVLRALAGLHATAHGSCTLRGTPVRLGDSVNTARNGIAFVSNDRKEEGLFLTRPVGDNLVATRLSELSRVGLRQLSAEQRVMKQLGEMTGLATRLKSRAGELSGGNQQKVFLGRNFARPGTQVLLVDEPTRGVDVGGRQAIHQLLREAAQAGMVVIFTSTETEELVELADVVITMRSGRVVNAHDPAPTVSVLIHETTHEEAQ